MTQNKHKQRSKLQKFLSFIFCFCCLKGKEEGVSNCDDRYSKNGNHSKTERGNKDVANCEDGSNSINYRDSEVDKNSKDDRKFDDDSISSFESQSDGDRSFEDGTISNDSRDTVDENNSEDSLYDVDVIDKDEEEIVVTRVYASASAHNIVRHHNNFFSRSESDTNIKNYISKKVQKRPNKKSRNNSEWAIPSNDREVRIDRWMDFYSEIDIHPDAENDMLADGEMILEDGPDNHFTGENGDMGNWDLYIG